MAFKKALIFALSISVSAGLTACGGGGGGGSSTSGTGRSASTGIRILHAAIDASPVDIYTSNSVTAIQTGRFALDSVYAGLKTGEQILTLTKAKDPTQSIAALPVTVEKSQHYSLLLYGNNESLGLSTNLYLDAPGKPSKGSALLRIVHGLVGAAGITSVVDAAEVSSSLPFGSASDYVEVAAGDHNIFVRRASDSTLVSSGVQSLASGGAYTLLVTGEVGFRVFARLYAD